VRINLDENLPAELARSLAGLGHDVQTVPGEGIAGSDDDTVRDAARREGRFLITQDLDLSDARKLQPGSHPGILLVRMRTPGRLALTARVASLFREEPVERWTGCLLVATDHKLRIRRPR